MKKFIFGRLVEADNLCNLINEKEQILKAINNGHNVVIYGPRNYGKTSLVKNIIIKEFQAKHKQSFVFFVDLFNAHDELTLNIRLKTALEQAMSTIPLKKWTDELKNFIAFLRPEFTIEPMTGTTKISFKTTNTNQSKNINDVFKVLKDISEKRTLLIVFDEFQDIASLKSAQGVIRGLLQEINASVIVMGSKSHLLREIFMKPKEPFYQWGINVDFKPIEYDTYYQYICERFGQKGIILDYEEAVVLQDNLHRVPEAINIVCAEIMDAFQNIKLEQEDIKKTTLSLIEAKQGQFEELLRNLPLKEQLILASLASRGSLKHYNSIEFLAEIQMNNKTVANTFKKLLDDGYIENYEGEYRINDPLLEIYLRMYR